MQPKFPHFKIFAAKTDSSLEDQPQLSKDTRLLVISDISTEQHDEMLEKMIGAVNLDIRTQASVITLPPESPIRLAAYCRGSNISEVLIFGLPPASLGLHIQGPAYHPLSIGGLHIIFAPSLDKIAGSKEMKLQLWQGLQNLFSNPS